MRSDMTQRETDEGKATARDQLWVLIATILGSSMVFIDGSVVNVALPVLQVDLKANAAEVQWVIEGYALFLSALILVGGSLGDHYGRRRIYALGVMLFTIASVGCGFAPNATILIAARAVQGIGGALLVPGSLAIITAAFDADTRGQAIGTWSGFTSITTALGPVIGGWMVENLTWRAVFFLNIPLAAIVLFLVFTRVPESRDPDARDLDIPGAILATAGLGAVVFGLIYASTTSLTDPVTIATLVAGIVGLVAFVVVEARSPSPMMPLSLFRNRTFSGTNGLTLLLYAALGAGLFYLPFNLQQVQGYSATEAGAASLPFAIIIFTLSRWSGGLITRYGAKLPLIIGATIAAAGFFLYTLPGKDRNYWTTFFPAIVVLSIGMAFIIAPLTTAVMGSVDQHRSGIASGINNAVSRVASLLAIAVFSIVVASAYNNSLDTRLTAANASPQERQQIVGQRSKLAGTEIPQSANSAKLRDVVDQSFIDAFRVVLYICVGMALISAVIAGILVDGRPPQTNAPPPLEART